MTTERHVDASASSANTPTGRVNERQASHQRFNANIHGARGLFSFMLLIFHVANSGLPLPPLPFVSFYQLGASSLAFGVDLFFVISGIVILGAFERAPSLKGFLIDRASRIYPVLWVTTTLVLVLLLFGRDKFAGYSGPEIAGVYVANLFAMPPVVWLPMVHPAAWSLSYEFAFYLLLALFGLMARWMPKGWAVALVVAAALIVFCFHLRAIYFVAGLMIGAGWTRRFWLRPLLRFPFLWLLLFLVAWQSVAVLSGGSIFNAMPVQVIGDPLRLSLASIAFVAALLAMGSIDQGLGWTSRSLRHPVMQWLGTISFSLYLWQTPIMALVKRGMETFGLVGLAGSLSQPLFLLLALPPTLIVSRYSQKFLEIGATNYLRRLRFSVDAKPVRTAP